MTARLEAIYKQGIDDLENIPDYQLPKIKRKVKQKGCGRGKKANTVCVRDGSEVTVYRSVKELQKVLNIDKKKIYRCIKERKQYRGMVIYYQDSE